MVSEKYKRLESRKSHRRLSNEERSDIQNEIKLLQSGIQEYVNAYKQANPDKQTPELTATTNNTNMISSNSANPTQRKLNESIPTSRKLSKNNKQTTRPKSRNTSGNTSRNTSRKTNVKLVKH
jgi:hypothetical protein